MLRQLNCLVSWRALARDVVVSDMLWRVACCYVFGRAFGVLRLECAFPSVAGFVAGCVVDLGMPCCICYLAVDRFEGLHSLGSCDRLG